MKIKKAISGIMSVMIFAGAVPVFSVNPVRNYAVTASSVDDDNDYTEETYENLTYIKYSDYIEITDCDESATEIIIPSEIDGLPVTSIGDTAFFCCSGLTLVIIPDSVTNIGYYAFSSCSSLKSVTIPDSVTSIGAYAFDYCSSLESIKIPESVVNIDENAFCDTPWLEARQKENPLVIVNNILIDGSTCEGDIVIPDIVTSIGDLAFDGCSGLTSVIIPESITSIGGGVFSDCSSLTSITIPDSVTSIGYGAFSDCSSLTSITIPDSVTSIGDSAFFECVGLTSVTIPDGVTNIGYNAFFNCYSLKSIIIPDSVTSIGDWAFSDCSGLESTTIPDSVTSIDRCAFCNCSNLESITILNPDCEIYDSSVTICSGRDDDWNYYFNGTIRGYSGSTAQAYAEKYGYDFEAIKETENPETLLGDANCDGEISVADSTLILQYCGNKDKYGLTEQGKINADVDGTAGISAVDALIIQQYDAGIINKF
ncbi:MAG: leucine-rich repeat protein [Ruminococcus sp.]|nr:leucine-rich repeat protein [Ruminococcus sp.]